MRQLDLTFSASYIGHRAWRGDDDDRVGGSLETLNAAIEHLERKNVVYEINVAKTTLSEALNESNEKRMAIEWLFKILVMLTLRGDDASAAFQRKILSDLVALCPRFALVDAQEEPTAEEIANAERLLAKAKARKRAA